MRKKPDFKNAANNIINRAPKLIADHVESLIDGIHQIAGITNNQKQYQEDILLYREIINEVISHYMKQNNVASYTTAYYLQSIRFNKLAYVESDKGEIIYDTDRIFDQLLRHGEEGCIKAGQLHIDQITDFNIKKMPENQKNTHIAKSYRIMDALINIGTYDSCVAAYSLLDWHDTYFLGNGKNSGLKAAHTNLYQKADKIMEVFISHNQEKSYESAIGMLHFTENYTSVISDKEAKDSFKEARKQKIAMIISNFENIKFMPEKEEYLLTEFKKLSPRAKPE